MDDVNQVVKNTIMAGPVSSEKPKDSYNEQIQKIASEQKDYKDEYEGFGSLTEMIKNTDKIAEK